MSPRPLVGALVLLALVSAPAALSAVDGAPPAPLAPPAAEAPPAPAPTPAAAPPAAPSAPALDACGGRQGEPNPNAGCLLPLERGINIDVWLRYGLPNEDVQPWDLERIRALGFTYVRLPVTPEPYERDGRVDDAAMAELDEKLDQVLDAGLAAIIDLHPRDHYGDPILRGGEAQDRYVAFLDEFARRLSARDPSKVALEMLNEPHDPDPQDGVEYDFNPAQRRFWAAARAGAPNMTLVATGSHWSGVEGLEKVEVLPDPNVIYDVHVYEPFVFTHQGATWTWDVVEPLRNVPYGSSPARVAPLLDALPPHVASHVRWYGEKEWGRERLAEVYDRIDAWADANGARVWVGEFGAFAPHAPPEDRARWVRDARELAEERDIAWAMWEWDRRFGLYDRATGEVDPLVAAALGLPEP